MTTDGRPDVQEADGLADWLLKNQTAEFSAVGHLNQVLHRVTAEGRIGYDELVFRQKEIGSMRPSELRRTAQHQRRAFAAMAAAP